MKKNYVKLNLELIVIIFFLEQIFFNNMTIVMNKMN